MKEWTFQLPEDSADLLIHLVLSYATALQRLVPADDDDPLARLEAELKASAPAQLDDPRLARLFPPAFDDEGEAAQFRRDALAQQAQARVTAAQTVLGGLHAASEDNSVRVREDEFDDWVLTLNGVRTSWHVELAGSGERQAEASPRQRRANASVAALVDWLGYLLEVGLAMRNQEWDESSGEWND